MMRWLIILLILISFIFSPIAYALNLELFVYDGGIYSNKLVKVISGERRNPNREYKNTRESFVNALTDYQLEINGLRPDIPFTLTFNCDEGGSVSQIFTPSSATFSLIGSFLEPQKDVSSCSIEVKQENRNDTINFHIVKTATGLDYYLEPTSTTITKGSNISNTIFYDVYSNKTYCPSNLRGGSLTIQKTNISSRFMNLLRALRALVAGPAQGFATPINPQEFFNYDYLTRALHADNYTTGTYAVSVVDNNNVLSNVATLEIGESPIVMPPDGTPPVGTPPDGTPPVGFFTLTLNVSPSNKGMIKATISGVTRTTTSSLEINLFNPPPDVTGSLQAITTTPSNNFQRWEVSQVSPGINININSSTSASTNFTLQPQPGGSASITAYFTQKFICRYGFAYTEDGTRAPDHDTECKAGIRE